MVTPAAPDPPIDVVASADDHRASVSWTAPADNGSPISSYTVTAAPGGVLLTVPSDQTQTWFEGPANTVTYSFRVTATNGVGTSDPSSPSNSVVPCGFDVLTSSLPGADLREPYSATLSACGGATPYHWKKIGKLPKGLKLNGASGVIFGRPVQRKNQFPYGIFHFTIEAQYRTKPLRGHAVTHTASAALFIDVE